MSILRSSSRATRRSTPTRDEARSELRRELLRPEYNEQNLVQRLLDLARASARQGPRRRRGRAPALHAGRDGDPGRAGRPARLAALAGPADRPRRATTTGPSSPTRSISADELRGPGRGRARRGPPRGRGRRRVPRASPIRQVERGRLADAPGATAHEVAVALGAEFPHLRRPGRGRRRPVRRRAVRRPAAPPPRRRRACSPSTTSCRCADEPTPSARRPRTAGRPGAAELVLRAGTAPRC